MDYNTLKDQFLSSTEYQKLYQLITTRCAEEIFQEDLVHDPEDNWNHLVLGIVFEWVSTVDPTSVSSVYQLCDDVVSSI